MDFSIKKNNNILLETIFQHIPQFIFWKDTNSLYLGCNEKYAKLIGLNDPTEIVGKSDYDLGWLTDGDTAEKFREGDRSTLSGNCTVNEEEWLSLPTGVKILTLINKVPLIDKRGKIVGVLGVATDITEKKYIEENYKRIDAQLKGMTMVAATIAHEIRTPLAAIKGAAKGIGSIVPLLVESYKKALDNNVDVPEIPDETMKLLDTVIANLGTKVDQSNLVIDMLLANIPNRNMSMEDMEICSAKTCINKALSQYIFPTKNCPDIVWEEKENDDFTFKGKEILVIHVLFNLLKNAIYFIHKAGRGSIYIWIEKTDLANFIHFKDTATGIKEEYVSKVFDDFFTHGTNKGTGIGLTFCKTSMKSLGGDIRCESIFGEYAEFILSFPKQEAN